MAKVSKQNSKLLQALLFFGAPIIILAIALGIIATPSLFVHPAHNFVFSSCPDYSCTNYFSVDASGAITEATSSRSYPYGSTAQLYLYNVTTDSYSPISVEQANAISLSSSSASPDGYSVGRSNSSGGFLFFDSGSTSSWVVKKGSFEKPITLSNGPDYATSITILGWEL